MWSVMMKLLEKREIETTKPDRLDA